MARLYSAQLQRLYKVTENVKWIPNFLNVDHVRSKNQIQTELKTDPSRRVGSLIPQSTNLKNLAPNISVESESRKDAEWFAFDETFHKVRQRLISEMISDETNTDMNSAQMIEAASYFDRVIMYNVPDGKRARGLSLVAAFKSFANPSAPDYAIKLDMARFLGWCGELLQAFALIHDDIEDNSVSRRGKPCWHRQVGPIAINDGLMLNCAMYALLDKSPLKDMPWYNELLHLIQEYTRRSVFGQMLDMMPSSTSGRVDLDRFTEERYANIVKFKTSYYSFCFPVRVALIIADVNDFETQKRAEDILLRIGHFFQVQDDYLDCYGTSNVTGKVGTDIQDGKCTWLIVEALKSASDHQRIVLQTNYGKGDEDSVKRIKSVYEELSLDTRFKLFEIDCRNEISELIKGTLSDHTGLKGDIFEELLSKTFLRQK